MDIKLLDIVIFNNSGFEVLVYFLNKCLVFDLFISIFICFVEFVLIFNVFIFNGDFY